MKISTPNKSELDINPLGALFTLTLNHTPILIPVTRGDGKTISTHICTPNFGKDTTQLYELKQHGNMRNERCGLTQVSENEICITHKITDNPGKYPAGVITKVDMKLSDTLFTLTLTHTNNGPEPAPVNAGVHCYFNAPLSYLGTKINTQDISSQVEHTGVLALSPKNLIQIPSMPPIILHQAGFTSLVVWVYQNEKGVCDKNYICIEPVENPPLSFGQDVSMINPGASRTAEFSISI